MTEKMSTQDMSIAEVVPGTAEADRVDMDNRAKRRASCIILHISSLPGPYGIGTMGKSACNFVDFLAEAGQKYWQILPLGPTSYGDSPYQSYSSFAGNPYLIDLDLLEEEGLLERTEFENVNFGSDETSVDYSLLYLYRFRVLKLAYHRRTEDHLKEMAIFREENAYWVEDYAMYMAIKKELLDISWVEWPDDIRQRQPEAMDKYREQLADEIDYYVFIQYLFFKQWKALRKYAHDHHVEIIGDIPIYISLDSADAWANPEILALDSKTCLPIEVGGCPPDGFSDDGQLWGNPIYNWDHLKEQDFEWWMRRIEINLEFFDILRLDHFIGFSSYWAIPYGDKNAKYGKRRLGPGIAFFDVLQERLGEVPIIVEDLGTQSKELLELKAAVGYPGMAVLQFGFFPFENADYVPHNVEENTIVYTGTHDNETIRGWLENLDSDSFEYVREYLNLTEEEGYNWGLVRAAMMTHSRLAVVQMQDYLNLGNEARMNEPSTLGKNWKWRVRKDDITRELAAKIKLVTRIYGRAN